MPKVNFSIDSALLKELGERLVGKPYIALAELVKNGYDADGNKVTIDINPVKDQIVVIDDGQGMTEDEFIAFWMRIGSTHKEKQRVSRKFKRAMTGSKGVGRLAVQFLARNLIIMTTSENNLNQQLVATVAWEKAVNAGNLNDAEVDYEVKKSADGFKKGTTIVLSSLKHDWTLPEVQGLASELWWLQPPFRDTTFNISESSQDFFIDFNSPYPSFVKIFNEGMQAILNLWVARIVGANVQGKVSLSLEYNGEAPTNYEFSIDHCKLVGGDWEIRIYNLVNRQPNRIKVDQAREYFDEYGGVHVYDNGFHLPYYGNQQNDWLKVEMDHSHRLSLSQLLPKELQVSQGMTFLPTLSRIFGVVNVNTSEEKDLKILITRDRLQESEAFKSLKDMVRWGLDLYAMEEKKRSSKLYELNEIVELPKVATVQDIFRKYEKDIPQPVYSSLKTEVEQATQTFETQAERIAEQVSLVGPLATAGISSLASQHELRLQFNSIDDILTQLREIKVPNPELQAKLNKVIENLSEWITRAKITNSLFSYFSSAENLQIKERFNAKTVIDEVKNQVKSLARDVVIDTTHVNEKILLPKASLTEWSAIFQNVLINSFNALVDSDKKLIKISSESNWVDRKIFIQDTGSGVDLEMAEELFQPFVRKIKLSPERRALGYGGMGLGLTIVRMIARNIGCSVHFVEPEMGFKTAFLLQWREIE